ncbi:TAT-variant-translocated molybdopterin oxidoreductase [Caenispirillum salinarum]|uniref:TAT-variant-translocated molybdopterin oxidoreductase n=1 Tax=Caenispirillum salinarum TaxID=859058 RepID=UPI00384B6249
MAENARHGTTPDIAALRRRLADARGPRLWKGLEEAADEPAFRTWLHAEFPAAAHLLDQPHARRTVLRTMAASFLLGGLSACDVYLPEDVVPWVEQPEAMVPGVPRFYASMIPFQGHARPVVIETHEGRPTRLDGNHRHPAATSALDPFTQAEVLRFYDPDRSATALRRGNPVSTAAARSQVLNTMQGLESGQGVRLLTGRTTSPTLLRQVEELKERLPGLRHHVWEPVDEVGPRLRAAELAFGRPLETRVRLAEADVVVSLEDDLLGAGLWQLDHAAAWAERRRRGHETGDLNRLYVAESTPTLAGAKAVERHDVPSNRIPHLAAAIAGELGVDAPPVSLASEDAAWARRMAALLKRHAGRAVLTVGAKAPVEVQALVLAVNERIGALGTTLQTLEPISPPADGGLPDLVDAMRDGAVDTLVILDLDPVFAAPGALDFAGALEAVPMSLHLGTYADATARLSSFHLPLAHPLETWSDGLATDGTACIQQPVARPLYGGVEVHAMLEAWLGRPGRTARHAVRRTWRAALGLDGGEARWERALHDGYVAGTAANEVSAPSVKALDVALPELAADRALEVVFGPDPSVWDGRYANVGWLQELPKPLTKLTWDNAALVSPALAERLGLSNGRLVEIAAEGRAVRIPVWIVPGQAAETVTLHFGQGRHLIGRLAEMAGTDVNPLRPAGGDVLLGASLDVLDETHALADTQMHGTMEGRDLIRAMPAAEVAGHGAPKGEAEETHHRTLHGRIFDYEKPGAEPYAWAMSIDLDTCIGCNACVVGCVAENNIPVVGPEQVRMGREMHWIRVDRYFEGDLDRPRIHFQPVPCMHCEHAPCEIGCPVRATVHGPEGLNQMIYNRCIGTRTCSSYCPYKVRRFNWFDYARPAAPGEEAVRNPDVTVRARGVMEKCTYCVQRISAARREAKKDDRRIADGEVQTACQTACPTQAIVFGDQSDPATRIARAKDDPRSYALLAETNTRPRTEYRALVIEDMDEEA